jgi:hypothetical protein
MRILVSALLMATCLSAHAGDWRTASAKSIDIYPNWVVTTDVGWKVAREQDRNLIIGLLLAGAITAFAIAMSRKSNAGGTRRRTRRIVRPRRMNYYY